MREKGDISKRDGAAKHSQVDFLRLVVRDLKNVLPYFAYNARSLSGMKLKTVFVLVISILRQFQMFNRYASFKSLQTAVSLGVHGN